MVGFLLVMDIRRKAWSEPLWRVPDHGGEAALAHAALHGDWPK